MGLCKYFPWYLFISHIVRGYDNVNNSISSQREEAQIGETCKNRLPLFEVALAVT
jgi:hypothetical protein